MKTVKTSIVCLVVTIFYCCSPGPEKLVVPDLKTKQPDASTFKLSASKSTPADNYSYALIQLTTKDLSIFLNNSEKVKFTTQFGTFENGTKEFVTYADFSGTAKAYLKSGSAQASTVTATIQDVYSLDTLVVFDPALPSQIIVEPAEASLKPSLKSTTLVTATLSRVLGSVTPGLRVNFYDSTGSGSVGVFLDNTSSDSASKATSNYWLQDTTYRGAVYLKAFVLKPDGTKTPKGVNRIIIAK